MPAQVLDVARRRHLAVGKIADELGISTESLRAWNKRFEVDVGEREGSSPDEREEFAACEGRTPAQTGM